MVPAILAVVQGGRTTSVTKVLTILDRVHRNVSIKLRCVIRKYRVISGPCYNEVKYLLYTNYITEL